MTEYDVHPMSFNTSHFHEILDYEFHRAARYKNAVTLMFIKLGHLDEIGRNHGQLTAGRILREIERLILGNTRHADRGFIYGKDEYMLILPHTPKDGAHCMASKLTRVIESYHFMNEIGARLTLTPKFGIASYPHDVRTREWLGEVIENVI